MAQHNRHVLPSGLEPEALLTPAEVADMFRVDPKTVTRWAKAGKLTSVRTLGGHRRYRQREVTDLLSGRIDRAPTPKTDPPQWIVPGLAGRTVTVEKATTAHRKMGEGLSLGQTVLTERVDGRIESATPTLEDPEVEAQAMADVLPGAVYVPLGGVR